MKRHYFTIPLLLLLAFFCSGCHAQANDSEPADDDRIILTLGGIYLDHIVETQYNYSGSSDLIMIVNDFNNSSERYKIQLCDYGVAYTDKIEQLHVEQSLTRMNTAILSDDCPDLLCFQNSSPISLIEKDLLMDLDPIIKADEGFQPELLLGPDALHQYGGLYILSPTCEIKTMMCSTETYEAHRDWTIEEYFDVERNLRDDQIMLWEVTQESYLRLYSSRYLAEALDFDNASCNFDNEKFLTILQGAQSIEPRNEEDPEAEGYVPDAPKLITAKRIAMGELIACNTAVEPWMIAFDRTQGEGKIAYIGWPTPNGGGGSDLSLTLPVGVSAGTEHAEGCWEFLKYMMTHPVFEYSSDSAPMYVPMLQEVYREDGFVTQQDLDHFCELANSCKTMSFTEDAVLDLIMKEADVMFQGNATPEEVAKRVQQSVSLYMMEKYG